MAQHDNTFYRYSTVCEQGWYKLVLDESSENQVQIIAHDDQGQDDEGDEGDEDIKAKEKLGSVSDAGKSNASKPNSSNSPSSLVAHHDNPIHVGTITFRDGLVSGKLRPSFWVIRLPGSTDHFEMYAARFAESLGPGYVNRCVWDERNINLGKIVHLGLFRGSEIALIEPATNIFGHASKESNPDEEIVGGPEACREF